MWWVGGHSDQGNELDEHTIISSVLTCDMWAPLETDGPSVIAGDGFGTHKLRQQKLSVCLRLLQHRHLFKSGLKDFHIPQWCARSQVIRWDETKKKKILLRKVVPVYQQSSLLYVRSKWIYKACLRFQKAGGGKGGCRTETTLCRAQCSESWLEGKGHTHTPFTQHTGTEP